MGTPTEKKRVRRVAARPSVAVAGIVCAAVLAGLPGQAAGRSGLPGANGKIAFESDSGGTGIEIYAMNADGSDQTDLTQNPGAADFGSAWSPDGSKLAFTTVRDGDSEVYVMNAYGSNQTNLTDNPAASDGFPAWSPGGTKIAFVSNLDGNDEVYVMGADGNGQTRLTNNPAADNSPAWSPGGERIAFTTNRDGDSEVYAMNADGSGPTNLTNNPAADITPAWSPDGSKIAFTSTRDGNDEIYVMNRDGTGQSRLTDSNLVNETSPVWAPDGTKIAFESDLGGDKEIYVMNADGSGQVPRTVNASIDMAPTWQPLPNDLEVGASVDAITVTVGSQATYTFSVRNNGSAPAPGAMLAVTPPGIMEVVSASPSQGWCETGATIACNLGTVGGLANASASIVGRALQTGTATAQGTIGVWGAEANLENDTAAASVSVVDPASGATPGTTPDFAPGVSVRVTYPKGLRSKKTKRIKRRALYRAISKGFRGEVTGATKLEGSLLRKRGSRCRKLAKAKRTSCSKTSRRGVRLASASASSSFRYRPLGSAKRAKRALRSGRRLKKGAYQLVVKAYPSSGEPQLFTFRIKSV